MEVESQPIFLSSLAVAIGARDLLENEAMQRRMSELLGQNFNVSQGSEREELLWQRALFRERLLRVRDSHPLVRALVINDLYGDSSNSPNPFQFPGVPGSVEGGRVHAADSFYPDIPGAAADMLISEMEHAQRLAREKGVDQSMIYKDNSLYEELIRSATNPRQWASGIIAAIERVNEIAAGRFADRLEETALPRAENGLGEEALQGTNMPSDAEYLGAVLEQGRMVLHILIAEDVERFWGPEGLKVLPAEIQRGIESYRNPLES